MIRLGFSLQFLNDRRRGSPANRWGRSREESRRVDGLAGTTMDTRVPCAHLRCGFPIRAASRDPRQWWAE